MIIKKMKQTPVPHDSAMLAVPALSMSCTRNQIRACSLTQQACHTALHSRPSSISRRHQQHCASRLQPPLNQSIRKGVRNGAGLAKTGCTGGRTPTYVICICHACAVPLAQFPLSGKCSSKCSAPKPDPVSVQWAALCRKPAQGPRGCPSGCRPASAANVGARALVTAAAAGKLPGGAIERDDVSASEVKPAL